MKLFSHFLFSLSFLPTIAFAAESPATYTMMAPLTGLLGPGSSLNLTKYLEGIVQVTIGIAGILAVIMMVYCGLKLMGTPSASGKSEAKECIANAIFGVLLALSAWILLNTINPLLLSNDLRLGDVQVLPATGTGNVIVPPGTYSWSTGALCEQIAGKIVAAVPPSYCSGAAPSATSICCGFVDSPLRQRTGSPIPTPAISPAMITPITGATPQTTTPTLITPPTPPVLDTRAPVITISSPQNNRATTSTSIPVTFSASDNDRIERMKYVYTPPSPGSVVETSICNSSCASPSVTATIPISIDTTISGTHKIKVFVCDSRQCSSQEVTVDIDAPCVPNAFMNCRNLPTGRAPTLPMCAPLVGTTRINVGVTTDAYAFKITGDAGGGVLHLLGGSQDEYPPPEYVGGGSCGQAVCTIESLNAGTQSVGCECTSRDDDGSCLTFTDIPNVIPANIVASISDTPGDISSTPTTALSPDKTVSGYCGNGGAIGGANLTFTISTNASGAGICTVQKDRTYYLNVTTIPFIEAGNPLYNIFWNFVPN